MTSDSFNPDSIKVNGKYYLTIIGFNKLRIHVGLEPIRPAPGERIEAFKARYATERKDFFVKYGHMFDGSLADETI